MPLENQGHQGAAHHVAVGTVGAGHQAAQVAAHPTKEAHHSASRAGKQMAQESQVAAAVHQAAAQGGSQEQQEA
ncbi:hypothetical protein GUJ93_ZPchr0009g476 [Zizania palustris]|uniref:Uncharacterized protein n=1 Tax=Zizania palustris TaxID=103762 RepID=A0A8J5RT68_ZIZPA|nr:hypothetical protein GUJ93_ZPchr0009g476 [Zizania palustris]